MDPLSDVFSLLKPQSYVSSGFDAGGRWAVRFTKQELAIKCYTITHGEGWLLVDGVDAPVKMFAGDCMVLASGRSFTLASHPEVEPVASTTVFLPRPPGGVVTYNGGGSFFLMGCRFVLPNEHTGIMLRALPPVIVLRNPGDQESMRWAIMRMRQELETQRPGYVLVAQHLAHMLLVQALRMHLTEGTSAGEGWFSALADTHLSAAIAAMHADPAHAWSVEELAKKAGMSRSGFAQRFKEVVGETPIDYLTRWRMLLAADRLATSDAPIAAVAEELGYGSESAFSSAFKRVMGAPPRRFSVTPRHSVG